MADQSDVEQALVTLISSILYPPVPMPTATAPVAGVGPAALGTVSSVVGAVCRIYRGWPNSPALDADLAAGRINVTVFPVIGGERNTTRFADRWLGAADPPSLVATISGNTAIFSGTAGPGQVVGLLVDGVGYSYRTQMGDTPANVAAALATQIQANRIASTANAAVTIPASNTIVARVVADTAAFRETRRQQQLFRISIWCPGPELRDVTATAIDAALADLTFIMLSDGGAGRLRFTGTTTFDQASDAMVYRRDLLYTVEYATSQTLAMPGMVFGTLSLDSAPDIFA